MPSLTRTLFVPFRHLKGAEFRAPEAEKRAITAQTLLPSAIATHDFNIATNAWLADGAPAKVVEGIGAATTVSEVAAVIMAAKAAAAMGDGATIATPNAARRLVEKHGAKVLEQKHPDVEPTSKEGRYLIEQEGGRELARRNPGKFLSNVARQAAWLGVAGAGGLTFALAEKMGPGLGHFLAEYTHLMAPSIAHEVGVGTVHLGGLVTASGAGVTAGLRGADAMGALSRQRVLGELGWSADEIAKASPPAAEKPGFFRNLFHHVEEKGEV